MALSHPQIGLGAATTIATIHHFRSTQAISLEEQLIYIGILGLLVISSFLWVAQSGADPEKVRAARMPRGVKVSLAAFFLVSGLMVTGTLLFLPLFGMSALKILIGPWSPLLLIIGAGLFLPFIERRVH